MMLLKQSGNLDIILKPMNEVRSVDCSVILDTRAYATVHIGQIAITCSPMKCDINQSGISVI
jgi:hypothetical protein